MSSIGNRTAILTLSRLANYGLLLISPIVLARLLSVAEFGRYREFLLYATMLQTVALFSINDSLLYFVPAYPASPWRVARHAAVLTLISSVAVVGAVAVVDISMGGTLLHGFLLPLAAFTLFCVNLDFWESFWIARGRPGAVFIYSACRLLGRLATTVATAVFTRNVDSIIRSLVIFEGARMVLSGAAFLAMSRTRREPPLVEPYRELLRFCIPSGLAALLGMLNKNLTSLVVARVLGVSALARYSVGRFGEPIVLTLRSSVSSVVLPEMVRKGQSERAGPLALWRRATVINTIFLFPIVVFVARYAQSLIVFAFGESYRGSAIVMQLYMLVVIRECFDFAPALRAIGQTRPLVGSNLLAVVACVAGLFLLIPRAGVAGAMGAFVIGSFVDVSYLAWRTARAYGAELHRIVPWASVGKVGLAALAASSFIISSIWTDTFGIAGVVLAGAMYCAVFALLLLALRVPEVLVLLEWARALLFRRASQAGHQISGRAGR
ncbi:MAG TPA: oligosaccharide flippase family protein [Steroidobacteraceae bacterium]|nr:oligosaccharide flippase family protein [Steroidobacteraceae bacterium]